MVAKSIILASVAMMLGLCGCQKEPQFDRRYSNVTMDIEARQQAIERDIASGNAMTDAAAEGGERRP